MVKIINGLIVLLAVLAIYFEYVGNRTLYVFLKPLTTILVISILFFSGKPQKFTFRNIILVALVFCLVGDVFLLNENYFILGLGSFLIGHLLFAWGFIKLEGFQSNWISFVLLTAVGIILFLWLKPDLGSFLIPVSLYILVILFMAWQGIGLIQKKRQKAYALIALAVILFMFSDSIIAVNKFKSSFKLAGPIILSTYWLSIALIANATHEIVSKQD